MQDKKYSLDELLKPFDFGTPIEVKKIYDYLVSFKAVSFPWYENVTVLAHIANVALFAVTIAQKAQKNKTKVDLHKTWLMGWLRDIGRVPWGIAVNQNLAEITDEYGHHGYLGYKFLLRSGVPEELAIISMTHIGSGVSADETKKINEVLSRKIFPEKDWYAKSLEEMIVVIADKIPGWKNTIVAPYESNKRGESKGNKIYSWLQDQDALWQRFWGFKKKVDYACGVDALNLFDQDLQISKPEAYARLPKPNEIAKMKF